MRSAGIFLVLAVAPRRDKFFEILIVKYNLHSSNFILRQNYTKIPKCGNFFNNFFHYLTIYILRESADPQTAVAVVGKKLSLLSKLSLK